MSTGTIVSSTSEVGRLRLQVERLTRWQERAMTLFAAVGKNLGNRPIVRRLLADADDLTNEALAHRPKPTKEPR